jgi:hypothetical protein
MRDNFYYNDKLLELLELFEDNGLLENNALPLKTKEMAAAFKCSLNSFYKWRMKKCAMSASSYHCVIARVYPFIDDKIKKTQESLAALQKIKKSELKKWEINH